MRIQNKNDPGPGFMWRHAGCRLFVLFFVLCWHSFEDTVSFFDSFFLAQALGSFCFSFCFAVCVGDRFVVRFRFALVSF